MVGNYKLKEINSENIDQHEKEWNSFIEQHPEGMFFHTTYHLKFLEMNGREIQSYIFLGEDGEIEGIFPIVKENFLFLERYKSPGFIGNIPFDEILPMVKKYFSKRAVYLILNYPNYKKEPKENEVCTFMLNIEGKTLDEVWKKDLNKKSRNMVRKAEKNKLKIKISNSKRELGNFYPLYLNKMREFKTKPYTLDSLNYLMECWKGVYIFNVYLDEEPIAGGTMILYKDTITSQLAASNPDHLSYAPNNFLYWKMIEFAFEKNCKLVNYGPSLLNDPVAKFKRSMGGKAVLYEDDVILNQFLYRLLQIGYTPLSRLKKFFHR